MTVPVATVEMTPAGILFGRGHLDRYQYDALGFVTNLLREVTKAMGGNLSVAGVWAAIIGALTKTVPGLPATIGDNDAPARWPRSARGSMVRKSLSCHSPPRTGYPTLWCVHLKAG